jgi:hypothetical protein
MVRVCVITCLLDMGSFFCTICSTGHEAQPLAYVVEDESLSVLGLATTSLMAAHTAMLQPVSCTMASSSGGDVQAVPAASGQVPAQALSEVYPLLAQRIREVLVHLASVLQQCVVASAPSTAAARSTRPGQRGGPFRADQGLPLAGSDQPSVKPGALLSNPPARAAAIELCHKLKQAMLPPQQL